MKVAQFIDTKSVGGAETMMFRLTLAMHQKNIDVVLLHMGNNYLVNLCNKHGIPHEEVPFQHLYQSIFTAQFFSLKFAKYLEEKKIDVLHTHLYGPVTGTFLGAFTKKIKHIATLHDVYLVQQRFGRGFLLGLASKLRTKLISVSKDMALFYDNYIPLKANIKTIYNGIAIPENQINKRNESKTITLISVGRLVALKRPKQLVVALERVIKSNNVVLKFVGDGPEFESLKKLVSKLGLTEKVELLGHRDDVQELLNAADIFLLNSETEGLSCSIIEAMASSLPCIVSDVGGNRELIKSDVNGYLYQKDDIQELSDRVVKLIKNNELRIKMGEQSFQKARNMFSIEKMTEDYLSLYQR
ncbi:glycosyltransferase [Pleionea sediminis]|uniref:glycosyltransferase n=1 Tax=Pleionea sediminis TaxID=2569479 RepID=UPI001185DFBF|nr:glycosyltransferase [Pleionea sediminis]